jgi:hypothetical protein
VVESITPAGVSGGYVRLSGAPLKNFEIRNAYGAVIGSKKADPAGKALVVFAMKDDLVDPRLYITQGSGTDVSPVTEARMSGSVADDVAQPTIRLSEHDGLSVITATTATPQARSTLMVRDAETNRLAEVSFRGDTATYVTATPQAARLLRVSLRDQAGPGYDRESIAETVTLSPESGSITPSAPSVDGVTVQGSMTVATLTAAPGAIVTIRDASEKVVAVHSAGADGRVSLPIRGAVAGSTLTATQSTGSFASDPAAITIP